MGNPALAKLHGIGSLDWAEIQRELGGVLRGQDATVELALATFLAGGHLLLEGPPGAGKTSLARAMARVLGLGFRRVQMTSDLLPSDIVGFLRLRAAGAGGAGADFEFRRGPIFTHILVADEFNRTSARTQTSLLEAMAERTVTVDGVTHRLPDPFFVVATQNPLEHQGVYPLAESQLDRFTALLDVEFPGREIELEIYREPASPAEPAEGPGADAAAIAQARTRVARIHVEDTVLEYVADIVRATRTAPRVVTGVSVRGGLQFVALARALAFLRGRDYVCPGDVGDAAVPALAHRLGGGEGDWGSPERKAVVREILERILPPR